MVALSRCTVYGPGLSVMNTYERHRLYVLRRKRRRMLLRRVLLAHAAALSLLALWSVIARVGPVAGVVDAPETVGARTAVRVLEQTVRSTARLDRLVRPAHRAAERDSALLLFRLQDSMPRGLDSAPVLPPLDIRVDEDLANMELPEAPVAGKRSLDILLIGIDSRLGRESGRADAIQLLTVDLDQGSLRITGVPRGTRSDLGYENEASNIISNVRAARGRPELLRRVARLCGRDSIGYWVEVGFSDMFGILEVLGYEQPGAQLQALRQRKGFQYGDHTRCYRQGQFVAQAIGRLLPLLQGPMGDVLIARGLDLVRSNLTETQCRGLATLLVERGLVGDASRVRVDVRSPFMARLQRDASRSGLNPAGGMAWDSGAEKRIRAVLSGTEHVAPRVVVSRLWTLFRQHGWMQISDVQCRIELRDTMAARLDRAWAQLGDEQARRQLWRTIEAEELLFRPLRLTPLSVNR